jgi:hypothetical protein
VAQDIAGIASLTIISTKANGANWSLAIKRAFNSGKLLFTHDAAGLLALAGEASSPKITPLIQVDANVCRINQRAPIFAIGAVS